MSLKRKAASGAKWSTASTAVTTMLKLAELGVLARLLSPEDFGLMSMVMVVIGFAEAYMDMGISNAIIYRQDSTPAELSSLYWLNLGAGLIIFVLVVLATPLIADFYNEPRIEDLLIWASLIFLITPWGQQFQALFQKELQFKLLALISMSAAFVGATVAIVSAFLGQGVYALIWGQLSNIGTRTTAFTVVGYTQWPPAFHFRPKDLKGYVGFGIYQMGEKALNYVEKNIDYLLIGRYLGPEILGAYTIAYQLVIVPLRKINPVLTRVAFPIFAKRQHHDTSLRTGYTEIGKMLTLILYPLLIGLAVTAPVAVPIFLGEGWGLTVVLIQILVLVGLARTLRSPSGILYLAKGRADIGFKFNLGVALVNTAIYWIAVQYGVIILALAAAILNIIYFVVLQSIINGLIGLNWKNYWQMLSTQFFLSLCMGAILYGLYLVLDPVFSDKLLLGLLIFAGAAVYIAFALLVEREFVKELSTVLRNKTKIVTD